MHYSEVTGGLNTILKYYTIYNSAVKLLTPCGFCLQLRPPLQRGGSTASLHNTSLRSTIFQLMIHTLDPLGEGNQSVTRPHLQPGGWGALKEFIWTPFLIFFYFHLILKRIFKLSVLCIRATEGILIRFYRFSSLCGGFDNKLINQE